MLFLYRVDNIQYEGICTPADKTFRKFSYVRIRYGFDYSKKQQGIASKEPGTSSIIVTQKSGINYEPGMGSILI